MNSLINHVKKSKKIKTYTKIPQTMKHTQVDDYNTLKPLCYTILKKAQTISTKVDGKLENNIKLKRGDYVLCGTKKEKYGMTLEKMLDSYDLGNVKNKKVVRKGFKLTKSLLNKHGINAKNNINIVPSWGGKQFLLKDDYILFETNNTGYYGINKEAFKKTYKSIV